MVQTVFVVCAWCRSRKGAWIEIAIPYFVASSTPSRSRKGAWIEIAQIVLRPHLLQSRSRKGAWIEISLIGSLSPGSASLP